MKVASPASTKQEAARRVGDLPARSESRRGRPCPAQGGKGAGPQTVQVERASGVLACRAEGRARRFRPLARGSVDARDEIPRAGRSGRGPAVPGRAPGGREGVVLRGVEAAALGLREPRLSRRPFSNLECPEPRAARAQGI